MRSSILLACAILSAGAARADFPVSIEVDRTSQLGPMKPFWRFFGADEPNYATMKDGKKLLSELGALDPGHVYFRAHNLLTTGDGVPALKWGSTNAYTEDAAGHPRYDWKILDGIFDTYRARGIHPYAQIGFMPEALSVHPEPYQHEWRPGLNYNVIGTGWSYPPKDYGKWADLVTAWVKHCVERYGRDEVNRWYWEVWNEANGAAYWHASAAEYYHLYDVSAAAVRTALPTARVGGPEAAGSGGSFTTGFLQHVEDHHSPLDFISFHAKGQPRWVDGHVRMGIAAQLGGMDKGFSLIAGFPALQDKPIVIGESDPDGCAACQGPQLGYRNTTLYASYTAATFGRELALADRHHVNLEGALTWAFEFEDQPFFAGQRTLATNAIDLPVLNVFRMLSRMRGERVAATSSSEVPLAEIIRFGVRKSPDVAALAVAAPDQIAVLVWHYHDDDLPGPSAAVHLALKGLPWGDGEVQVRQYRIDDSHSNAFTVWKGMGSPTAPNDAQYAELVKAGQLGEMPLAQARVDQGQAAVDLSLPRQAVALIVIRP